MKTLVALIAVLVSFFSVGNLLADEPELDGSLLILRDAQDGVAGLMGKDWFISESGDYEVVSVVAGKDNALLRKGKLSKEQLDDLVAYVKYRDVDSMPVMLGDFDAVNGHEIVLTWDKNSTRVSDDSKFHFRVLVLKPGQTLESAELEYAKSDSEDAVYVDRFASIVKTIKSLCFE